ncbi:MAG: ethanolamine ammonia-lyase subunit EutC [Solirubrobacteraceae bacterium]|nr:ethanolamine ammonia-lyase subunit EutC [Patulibacter sp.]
MSGAADDAGAGAGASAPASAASTEPTEPGLRVVDPWLELRRFTPARIGLGRAGDALATKDQLALRLAHAQARDAVHAALDVDAIRGALDGHEVLHVRSAAPDRATYLQRPDLGRVLAEGEAARLRSAAVPVEAKGGPAVGATSGFDLAFVLADGLSPVAVQEHAASVLRATVSALPGWSVAPVVVATQARVALGDPIGEAIGARFVVVLVGERPGLSAADSLGLYLTYEPRTGRRDSERNCISNVRPPVGLSYEAAGHKLATLLREGLRLGLTGVGLKDEGPSLGA